MELILCILGCLYLLAIGGTSTRSRGCRTPGPIGRKPAPPPAPPAKQ